MPKVSVIIPSFNSGPFLVEAIESVATQTFSDLETIVVDDGSTDDTCERVARIRHKITYIHQDNRGLPAARNRGIQAGSGRYFAFLDADDLWRPQKLEKQVPILDERPDVGLVTTWAQYIDDVGNLLPEIRSPVAEEDALSQVLRACWVGVSGAVITRECFNRCGLFDEQFRSNEDYDLWIRIALSGYRFAVVEEPLARYRLHGQNMSLNVDSEAKGVFAVLDKTFTDGALPQAARRSRDAIYAHHHLSFAWESLRIGRTDRAREHITKAVRLDPSALFDWRVFDSLLLLLLPPGRRVPSERNRELQAIVQAYRQAIETLIVPEAFSPPSGVLAVQARSYASLALAFAFASCRRTRRALMELFRAIRMRPPLLLNPGAFLTMAKSFLSPRTRATARRLKTRLSRVGRHPGRSLQWQ